MKLFINFFIRIKVWGYHHYPRVYSLTSRHKAIVKFVMSGGIAGAVDLIALYLFHGLFLINVIVSTTLAFILSFWVSFYLQKFWTFRDHGQQEIFKQVGLYMLIAFINLNLNGLLMHIFVNRLQFNYLLSQVVVSLLIGLESFVVYKRIVFRNCKQNQEEKL